MTYSNTLHRYARTAGLLGLVVLVAPFVVFAVPQVAGASHSYVVLSDSMSPTIAAGDVVLVEDAPASAIDRGDVVTYERPGTSGELVTHRVVEVASAGDSLAFRTQGDANEDPDAYSVPAAAIVGRVAFDIPLIGHVIAFANTTVGTVALVVVPAVLLVANELWTLYRAATDAEPNAN
jgi:signal peptidase